MALMTQVELEAEMIDGGRARARKMFENNMEAGNAAANPYASAIFKRFVLPLSEIIKEDRGGKVTGRRLAHTSLMADMDAEAVAFIAVRGALNSCLNTSERGGRNAISAVGRTVYNEYCLTKFETANPALYHTIVNDFDRKMTKSERHRVTVFKMQARDAGISFVEWGIGGQTQVGAYLLECLQDLGMVEIFNERIKKGNAVRNVIEVLLTKEVRDLLTKIQAHIMETTPEVMPCVEPPKDWVAVDDGGWHTLGMRRIHPNCVRARPVQQEHFRNNDMSVEFGAINALQATRWCVNERMLDTIRNISRHFDMDEVISQAELPAPPKPAWLEQGMAHDDMSESQRAEFSQWKHTKAEWFTQMKLRGTKWGRFFTATRMAEKFRHYPSLYFVYFADFRGRKYVQSTGISPQGSDMQKALLKFAEGKALLTDAAKEWFQINGANRFGVDKVSIADRIKWVVEHKVEILGFADDPISNSGWRDADSPLQFLAWCFEYSDWLKFGDSFKSHIPVGMDGSCNGLQNFSAMLRDQVGGEATNLTPSDTPKDIYAMVARVTAEKLLAADPDPDGFRALWLAHGINRTLVKRSVMTLPYGSTRFSCADFIVGDYMKMGKATEFAKEQYGRAANYLSHFVWKSIGDVVIKAREAMDWLQLSAKKLIKEGYTEISWITPSGFPAIQCYWETEIHRINTRICGGTKLSVQKETDAPDSKRHCNGIAPNFIHSMDASHLTLVVNKAKSLGIKSLAMIHDDYGTHAADAPVLAQAIREVFVDMYGSSSPLQELYDKYPSLTSPPELGSLVLEEVINSKYFFC